jgi:hypothetical protein
MARRQASSQRLRSIIGGSLAGIGLYLSSVRVDEAMAHVSRVLGIGGRDGFGVLPTLTLAASQAVQAYGFDQHRFREDALLTLLQFWPLFLVLVGTALLRDVFTDRVKASPAATKYLQNNVAGCRFRCPSFDV